MRGAILQLSAGGSLGLLLNSGSRSFERFSFGLVALRRADHRLAQVDVPVALSLAVVGAQFTPTVGVAAQFNLSTTLSPLSAGPRAEVG